MYNLLVRSGYKAKNNKVRAPMYFGENDSVAGPYYGGTAIVFLFILS